MQVAQDDTERARSARIDELEECLADAQAAVLSADWMLADLEASQGGQRVATDTAAQNDEGTDEPSNEQTEEAFDPKTFRGLQRLRGFVQGALALQVKQSSWSEPDADDPVVHLLRDAADLLEEVVYRFSDDKTGLSQEAAP